MPTIRFARSDDAERVVALIRSSFDREMLDVMIYGCSGVSRYVKAQIATPQELSDTVYIVAEHDGELTGCVEMRILPDTLFLNYICTAASRRERGLGSELLARAVELNAGIPHTRMSLDVFSANAVAVSWYTRLGFKADHATNWWRIPLPPSGMFPGKIAGSPQADLCQEHFGFSRFDLNTGSGSYPVGRIGDKWYRVSEPALLRDPEALACLRALDPGRTVLGLFRDDNGPVHLPGAVIFSKSVRMSTEIGTLLRNLRNGGN